MPKNDEKPPTGEIAAVPEVLGPEVLDRWVPAPEQVEQLKQLDPSQVDAVDSTDVLKKPIQLNDDEKGQLVGKEFTVIGWQFHTGDYGPTYVTVHVLADGQYYIFNDGSRGVHDEILWLIDEWKRKGENPRPIRFRQGLRRSDYFVDPETGETFREKPLDRKTTPATTYYLS